MKKFYHRLGIDKYFKVGMVIVIFLIILILVHPFYKEKPQITGAVGEVKVIVCSNPMTLQDIGNYTLRVGSEFVLGISSTNPSNGTLNFSVSPSSFNVANFTLRKVNNTRAMFNVTPKKADVGNYSLTFSVTDGWCSDEEEGFFEVRFNNSPPILIKPIPNQTWEQDKSITPFKLSDYYYDPDGDPISYSAIQPNNIEITISDESVVTFTSDPGWYGTRYTKFTGCDPFDACTDSNVVKLKVKKVKQPKPPPPAEAGMPPECEEDWNCTQWSKCINGTQTRNCTDLNECGTTKNKPNEIRSCIMETTTTTTTTITTTTSSTTTTIKKKKIPVRRKPWLVMFLMILLALIIEIHTYYARKKGKPSYIIRSFAPFLTSLSLIFGSLFYYIFYLCRVPEACKQVPFNEIVISLAAFFILLVIIRLKWKSILKKVKELKIRKKDKLRKELNNLLKGKFGVKSIRSKNLERKIKKKLDKKTANKIIKLVKKIRKQKENKKLIKEMKRLIKYMEEHR